MNTLTQLEDLQYSQGYADYICEFSRGDRTICDGDSLLLAMEDDYLFKEYLEHIGKSDLLEI
jgi:hypothetical protein